MSQNQEILKHLKEGKTITPLDALREFGCFRLAARVYDLRLKGYDIITVSDKNSPCAEYMMR